MECRIVRENLFAWQEGRLSGEKLAAFEKHASSCGSCAAVVNGFRSVSSIIAEKQSIAVDPFAATRAIGRIESELRTGEARRAPLYHWMLQPAAITLVVLFAVAVGYSLGRQITGRQSDSLARELNIRVMQDELYLTDLMDEDRTFFINQ